MGSLQSELAKLDAQQKAEEKAKLRKKYDQRCQHSLKKLAKKKGGK